MIIRKPYAFLIKNFRKIHILLLVLSLYLAYRILDINRFVNEFMRFGTYDLYADPITNHITFIMNFVIVIMILGSLALLLLLSHKNKPWKIYMIPLINYVALFFILSVIKNFFKTYNVAVDVADLRFSRDLLYAFVVVQLPVIGIFLMRTFGIDINKFNFNSDKEFLELSEEDREEVEISLDVDVNTFKRLYRKFLRNISYFYQEHKLICKIFICVISLVLLFNIYTLVFITNKSYNETEKYNYNGFTIKINNSYITDKDYKGDIISKKSKFVIINISLTNNTNYPKKFDTSRFHLKAGNMDFTTTESTFANEFYDLGKTYSKVREINGNDTVNFIIVYKVDSNINNDRYVLYFQEKSNDNILRKLKLKLKDLSVIGNIHEYHIGDSFDNNVISSQDNLSIDHVNIVNDFSYNYEKCSISNCIVDTNQYISSDSEKIIFLEFASEKWESKQIVDYLSKSAKIEYINEDDILESNNISFALNNNYLGKVAYIKVPNTIENYKDIRLHFISRNKEFYYNLS